MLGRTASFVILNPVEIELVLWEIIWPIRINWLETRIKGTIGGYGRVRFRHKYRFVDVQTNQEKLM